MQKISLVSLAVGTTMLLSPVASMARIVSDEPTPPTSRDLSNSETYRQDVAPNWNDSEEDDDLTDEDIMDAMPTDMGGMGMGMGGGGYYPYPSPGGVSVDVTATKQVTPDVVSISAYCDPGVNGSRSEVKDAMKKLFNAIKDEVGSDGTVRRSGGYSIYPYYDPMTGMNKPDSYMGNLSLWIDVKNLSANSRISEAVEDAGCTVSWNVSMSDMHSVENDVIDELVRKLGKRKEVYEKLLGTKLGAVTGAYFSTWIDGWTSYDPDANSAMATVTLNVTFETK